MRVVTKTCPVARTRLALTHVAALRKWPLYSLQTITVVSMFQPADAVSGWEPPQLASGRTGRTGAAQQLESLIQQFLPHPRRAGETERCGQAGHGWKQGGESGLVHTGTDEPAEKYWPPVRECVRLRHFPLVAGVNVGQLWLRLQQCLDKIHSQ